MPKIANNSVLFRLGAITHLPTSKSSITDIRALRSGESVYNDPIIGVPKSTLENVAAPQSILARTPPSQEDASEIDWDKLIIGAATPEESIAAVKLAGQRKDARAVSAILNAAGDSFFFIRLIDHGETANFFSAFEETLVHIGQQAMPGLISLIQRNINPSDEECEMICYHSASAIERIVEAGGDGTQAIPILIEWIKAGAGRHDEADLEMAVGVLSTIGGEEIRPRIIDALKRGPHILGNGLVQRQLESWGYSREQIADIWAREGLENGVKAKIDRPKFDDPLHDAAYSILERGNDAKREVLAHGSVLQALSDPQGWITINDPQLAHEALEMVVSKANAKRGKLDNAIKAALGVRISDIEDEHYTYYADEILDAVVQFVKQSNLNNDPGVDGVLSKVKYGDDIKLRYIRRDISDTSLGSKCGDCTSKGSIHFGDSMMWFINPAYQIIRMSKGKRFIGKIHFALGSFGGEDSIIIDALEFNPQAQEGKPYYEDGVACFTEAMEFLKDLARRQNRNLIALTTSNSSGAVEMLKMWGEELVYDAVLDADGTEHVAMVLLIAHEQIRDLLKQHGYDGEIRLYYQMLGESAAVGSAGGRDLLDDKLPTLEREVINPAQITDEDVAAAMRSRDFALAAQRIMANPTWNQQVKTIFGFSADMSVSPAFLAKRLQVIYRDEALAIESLKRGFRVHPERFRQIPTMDKRTAELLDQLLKIGKR